MELPVAVLCYFCRRTIQNSAPQQRAGLPSFESRRDVRVCAFCWLLKAVELFMNRDKCQ